MVGGAQRCGKTSKQACLRPNHIHGECMVGGQTLSIAIPVDPVRVHMFIKLVVCHRGSGLATPPVMEKEPITFDWNHVRTGLTSEHGYQVFPDG